MRKARRRSAYTLLEVLLSLTIAVILMAALSATIGFQLRQAQVGRDYAGQNTLVRSVILRVENDLTSAVSLPDPGRFRNVQADQQRQQQFAAMGGGSTTTTGTGATTTTTTTTSTATATQATGQSTQSTQTTQTGQTGTTGTTATAESADSTTENSGEAAGFNGPVVLPLAVIGDSTSITIFTSKVVTDYEQVNSDTRCISYWAGDSGAGLCRRELKVATANDALTMQIPTGDVASFLIAPEVKSVQFRYFDGTGWSDSWDSTAPGDDGITPVGSPRAIEVRLGIQPPGTTEEADIKYHRHVISIPTANAVTQATNGGGETPP